MSTKITQILDILLPLATSTYSRSGGRCNFDAQELGKLLLDPTVPIDDYQRSAARVFLNSSAFAPQLEAFKEQLEHAFKLAGPDVYQVLGEMLARYKTPAILEMLFKIYKPQLEQQSLEVLEKREFSRLQGDPVFLDKAKAEVEERLRPAVEKQLRDEIRQTVGKSVRDEVRAELRVKLEPAVRQELQEDLTRQIEKHVLREERLGKLARRLLKAGDEEAEKVADRVAKKVKKEE